MSDKFTSGQIKQSRFLDQSVVFSINYTGTFHPVFLRGNGNPFSSLTGQIVSST